MRVKPDAARGIHATVANTRARATYGCASRSARASPAYGGLAFFAWNGWAPRQVAAYNSVGGQALHCTISGKGALGNIIVVH
eukprot:10409684-Alexandrium_andersonii.AAC.1